MSLSVVGSFGLDTIRTPFGARDDVLGGSASFLSTAASFFCPVQLAGVIGEDFPAEHLAFFRSRQIDLQGVQTLPGKTFRWHGDYQQDMNVAQTLETQLNVLADFHPNLAAAARHNPLLVLGNLDPTLQLAALQQMQPTPAAQRFVACDTMNYWIERHNTPLRQLLQHIDLLLINEGEARLLAQEHYLLRAAQRILAMGPQRLIIKRGEYGALFFDPSGLFVLPGYPLDTLRDPTGAGDTFAGALMGYLEMRRQQMPLLTHATLCQGVVVASVLASFVVEDFSLDRLRTLSLDAIHQRIHAFAQRTQFNPHSITAA